MLTDKLQRFIKSSWAPTFASILLSATFIGAQDHPVKSQEVSEADGVPVLIKHLPSWERVRPQAVLVTDRTTLQEALGNKPVLDLVDFSAGTEAVTAPYPEGRLLIVEYTSPQSSTEADDRFRQFLLQNDDGRTEYRRVGNYSVFVFDAADLAAANSLIDQVRYEKSVQWLGEDPYLIERLERAFVVTMTDVFISTVQWIVLGIVVSLAGGLIAGYFFFQFREKQRKQFKEYSDAGGMVRLNLDGLTPDLTSSRLLKD